MANIWIPASGRCGPIPSTQHTHIFRGEGTLRSTDPSISFSEVNYVLRDYVEHEPVDKALFRTDPPAGWTNVDI